MGLKSSSTFVELGAGHGWGIKTALKIADPQRIVGVEISPDFRQILNNVINEELTPEQAAKIEIYGDDCISMPYLGDNSVDQIFAMNVVYFLDPLNQYIQEIHRVLRPGGAVTFGCKFHNVPSGTKEFVNIEQEAIVSVMEQEGLAVDVEEVNSGKMSMWTAVKGTKILSSM